MLWGAKLFSGDVVVVGNMVSYLKRGAMKINFPVERMVREVLSFEYAHIRYIRLNNNFLFLFNGGK